MGIDLRVAGDVDSCRATASQLRRLSEGITHGGTAFHTARSESESLWTGQAGDAFRGRLQPIGKSTDDIADHTNTAGVALDSFADDLSTVKSRMNQARGIATGAGLTVNGDNIEEPKAPATDTGMSGATGAPAAPVTPSGSQAQGDYQRQQQAYRQAQQTVSDARTIEQNAHNALEPKMSAWKTMAEDAADQWYWLAANTGTGVVGTAISKADKWGQKAATRTEQAQIWRKVASELEDPYDISRTAAQAGVYEKDVAKFQKLFKSNSKLTAGLRGYKIGDFLSLNTKELFNLGGKLGKIGERIPVIGAGLAIGQTAYDIATDKDKSAGSIGKHVGSDIGGFMVGTAATEGTLALAGTVGLAGGPVTLAAVGVGIGVAYGVGEVVNHWPAISHWAGDTAGDVAHGVTDAGKSVGHFFSSVF